MRKNGFSLVEVLIVISIIAILGVVGIPSYLSSAQKGRDAKRKADLNTIQKGLEAYFNDYGIYPATTAGSDLCADTSHCYLKTTPTDPSGYTYYYIRRSVNGSNQSFQLYSTLESNIDTPTGNDDTGTGTGSYGNNCGSGTACKYGISSTDITPSTP